MNPDLMELAILKVMIQIATLLLALLDFLDFRNVVGRNVVGRNVVGNQEVISHSCGKIT